MTPWPTICASSTCRPCELHNIRVHVIAKGISTINYKSTLFGYNRTHSEVSERGERVKTGACKVTFIVWALVLLHCILFGVLWFMCRMTRWACAFVYCGFSSECIIYCLFIFHIFLLSFCICKLLFHCRRYKQSWCYCWPQKFCDLDCWLFIEN